MSYLKEREGNEAMLVGGLYGVAEAAIVIGIYLADGGIVQDQGTHVR